MTPPSPKELAGRIEYALFKADATGREIEEYCKEAREHFFFGVCVNGSRVELARMALEGSEVQVVALVGFPLGAGDADVKRYETEAAIDQGAQEIDFVINIGRLKEGDSRYILREVRDVVEAADERPVKAVLEIHLLAREEKAMAAKLAQEGGAQFICTSTDFHAAEVTVEEIKWLREAVGGSIGIKAAGGIRDMSKAMALYEAGATRIGTTTGAGMVKGLNG